MTLCQKLVSAPSFCSQGSDGHQSRMNLRDARFAFRAFFFRFYSYFWY